MVYYYFYCSTVLRFSHGTHSLCARHCTQNKKIILVLKNLHANTWLFARQCILDSNYLICSNPDHLSSFLMESSYWHHSC